MSMQTGLALFERAVESRGRLLRVEADRLGATPRQLVLTFDVGRVLIRPTDDGLSMSPVEDRAALPAGLVSLEEDEPWWRVLGQPVTAAWPGGIEEAVGARSAGPPLGEELLELKLRFREEAQNPRIVSLAAAGPAVRVVLEG